MTSWQGAFLESIANELKNIREILERQTNTERKSGEWLVEMQTKAETFYRCSECNVGTYTRFHYCFSCGAKMEESGDE